jgi:hypothetical protein
MSIHSGLAGLHFGKDATEREGFAERREGKYGLPPEEDGALRFATRSL